MIPYTPIPFLSIGPLTLPWWGVMQVLGIGLATYVAHKEAKRFKLDTKHVVNVLLIMLGFGLLGMRLYHFAAVKEYGFSLKTLQYAFTFSGGLDSAGGILGILAVIVYVIHTNIAWKQYLDVFALPMAILVMFSRLGCAGILDELGKTTNLPWAVFYHDALRHPVSWYYFLFGIILFILVYQLRNYNFRSGILFAITSGTYFSWRFFIDFTRAFPKPVFMNMSIHQIVYGIAAIVAIGCITCIWIKHKSILERTKKK